MGRILLLCVMSLGTVFSAAADDAPDYELGRRVNKAIDRGVKALKGMQRKDGTWPDLVGFDGGQAALALLALSRSGVPTDDPVMRSGFTQLMKQKLSKTYTVSVTVMAIEAAYGARDPRKYFRVPRSCPRPVVDWMARCTKWLVDKYDGAHKGWRYPDGGGSDHSHVQYASLALKASCRFGVGRLIPNQIWRDVLVGMLASQEKTGPMVTVLGARETVKGAGSVEVPYRPTRPVAARGWDYDPKWQGDERPAGTRPAGSMTTAGVAIVALCRSELIRRRDRGYSAKLDKAAKASIEGGLAWTAHYFTVKTNPRHPDGRWHLYYLYGLERVGIFLDLKRIGKHDWYRDGARYLVAQQSRHGQWGNGVQNTSFALLFLKRSSVPIITTTSSKRPRAMEQELPRGLAHRPKIDGVGEQRPPRPGEKDPAEAGTGTDGPGPDNNYKEIVPKIKVPFLGKRISRYKIAFVLDKSGSMAGLMPKIVKELETVLPELTDKHRFNIIFFDGQNHHLADGLLPATKENIDAALKFARGQAAKGGTDPLPALQAGMAVKGVESVLFMTDGRLSKHAYDWILGYLTKVTDPKNAKKRWVRLQLVHVADSKTPLGHTARTQWETLLALEAKQPD